MLLLCRRHIWYNIFCLFIFHFKLSWDHVKLSVIFHSGVHLSVTKSSYSLDYETDDLSKLRITISSGAWRILKENIAKLINFYMLSANQESQVFFCTPKILINKVEAFNVPFSINEYFCESKCGRNVGGSLQNDFQKYNWMNLNEIWKMEIVESDSTIG